MTKKIYSILMAAAMLVAAVATSGCKKDEPQQHGKVQKYHMSINASKGENGDKAHAPKKVISDLGNGTLSTAWDKDNDVVYVYHHQTSPTSAYIRVGELIPNSSGSSETTLEGDIEASGLVKNSQLCLIYHADPTYGYEDQLGTLADISNNFDYAWADVYVTEIDGSDVSTGDAEFENEQTIVKFTLVDKADGTTPLSASALTIHADLPGEDKTADKLYTTYSPFTTDDCVFGDIVATPTSATNEIWVALRGQTSGSHSGGCVALDYAITATVGGDTYTCTKTNTTLEYGSFYNITLQMTKQEFSLTGALPGEFSVSPTKKVRFSIGNLLFNAMAGTHKCADGTTKKGVWKFAENQWDIVLENGEHPEISSTYDGWIDRFGWGTSGYDNTANDPFAINYQPWSTNESPISQTSTIGGISYQSENVNKWGYGPSTCMEETNLIGVNSYYDWGIYNPIENGGNQPGMWRTLSIDEWDYLFYSRTNAENLSGIGIVNGVNGLILLPDNWTIISGIEFTPSNHYNHQCSNFSCNTYTADQWNEMASMGAVFLPAAGSRDNIIVFDKGEIGIYWTSTHIDQDIAKRVGIDYNAEYLFYHRRCTGNTVRLVQDVE